MISGTAQKIDLYDLFSVLLPGGAVILAFFPFLPQGFSVDPAVLLLVLIFSGYVVGRGIHAAAVEIEDLYESIPTHRERFIDEIKNCDDLSKPLVEQFCDECEKEFDILDAENGSGGIARSDLTDRELDDLYSLVRSYIHIDSRGRSRTFQAVYAFYRGMWVASVVVALGYFSYGLLDGTGVLEQSNLYVSYFGSLNLNLILVMYGAAAVVYTGHRIFRVARAEYQRLYIQYLISDFLILQGVDYPEAIVQAVYPEDGGE